MYHSEIMLLLFAGFFGVLFVVAWFRRARFVPPLMPRTEAYLESLGRPKLQIYDRWTTQCEYTPEGGVWAPCHREAGHDGPCAHVFAESMVKNYYKGVEV